jgi:hypothetical protein
MRMLRRSLAEQSVCALQPSPDPVYLRRSARLSLPQEAAANRFRSSDAGLAVRQSGCREHGLARNVCRAPESDRQADARPGDPGRALVVVPATGRRAARRIRLSAAVIISQPEPSTEEKAVTVSSVSPS